MTLTKRTNNRARAFVSLPDHAFARLIFSRFCCLFVWFALFTGKLIALPQVVLPDSKALMIEKTATPTARLAARIADTTIEKSLPTMEGAEADDFDLANAPAVDEPTASPTMHLNKPRFAWIPTVGVEVRPDNERSFSAASTSRDLAEGSHIRFFRRTSSGNSATPSAILLPPNGTTLTFFPGAVFQLRQRRIDPKLGRYHLVLPQIADFEIVFPSGAVFYLTSGEAFFELDAQGEGTVAVPRGSGWLKDIGRKTQKLSAGKQIGISRIGVLTRMREIDSRWKATLYQGFAPVPDVMKTSLVRAGTSDEDDREQSEEDSEEGEDSTALAADVTGDIRQQIASATRELQESSASEAIPMVVATGSPTATFTTDMVDAATMTEKVQVTNSTNDNLPKVSDSLMAFMSPEARALMTRNPASATLPTPIASATVSAFEKAPARRNQPQNLLKDLARQVPELHQLALPDSSSRQAAQDFLKQLPGAALPIPPVTWRYFMLPGFPPIPVPSLALPAGLIPGRDTRR